MAESAPAQMEVSIRTNNEQFMVRVTSASDTILDVKKAIYEAKKYPVESQNLVFAGTELQDDRTLQSYHMLTETAVHLTIQAALSLTTQE